MAIKPNKIKSTVKSTEDDPDVEAVASESSEDVPEAVLPEVKATEPKKLAPGALIKQPEETTTVDISEKDKDELVLVTMHEDMDPAPRVGTFDCKHRIAARLAKNKTYRVPKHVAEVLIDANKATVISID